MGRGTLVSVCQYVNSATGGSLLLGGAGEWIGGGDEGKVGKVSMEAMSCGPSVDAVG